MHTAARANEQVSVRDALLSDRVYQILDNLFLWNKEIVDEEISLKQEEERLMKQLIKIKKRQKTLKENKSILSRLLN